jgi:hypothetical protein
MTTIEKIEKGIITLAEFTEDQQSFIRGIVKLSFNEGQEQALRIHDVMPSCEGNCGMNYCDDNGCIERKRILVEPTDLPEHGA